MCEETNLCMDEAPIQAETCLNVESTENTANVDKLVVPEAVDALDDEGC